MELKSIQGKFGLSYTVNVLINGLLNRKLHCFKVLDNLKDLLGIPCSRF
jgi:hypothetical protein